MEKEKIEGLNIVAADDEFIPEVCGQPGKYLSTDGETVFWQTLPEAQTDLPIEVDGSENVIITPVGGYVYLVADDVDPCINLNLAVPSAYDGHAEGEVSSYFWLQSQHEHAEGDSGGCVWVMRSGRNPGHPPVTAIEMNLADRPLGDETKGCGVIEVHPKVTIQSQSRGWNMLMRQNTDGDQDILCRQFNKTIAITGWDTVFIGTQGSGTDYEWSSSEFDPANYSLVVDGVQVTLLATPSVATAMWLTAEVVPEAGGVGPLVNVYVWKPTSAADCTPIASATEVQVAVQVDYHIIKVA